MQYLDQLLENNSILLLFLVISIGVLVGNFSFRKKNLGVSSVLFIGLIFGYLNPDYSIPEVILVLGLSVFMYTIGLTSGPIFFDSYKNNGIRDFTFSFVLLSIAGLFAALIWLLFDFSAASISGIYAGISTNTPAFVTVLEYIQNIDKKQPDAGGDLVVSYTLAYPIGVLGSMLSILIMEKLMKVDYLSEYKKLRTVYPLDNDLTSAAVKITNQDVCDVSIRELFQQYNWNIKFGRVLKGDHISLANWDTHLNVGDEVMIIGSQEDIKEAITLIGERRKHISHENTDFDSRRIFMSKPELAGKSIASLNIPKNFNAIITRIRRGDNDMLAHGDTVLELGDRIRFVARRDDLKALSDYFGDSYQASSRLNLFPFGVGISLGLLLGNLIIPLGGDLTLKIGFAGGPIIVGLILGSVRRTGPILWTMPYSTTVIIQQLGLMFLLSYIGVNNGSVFFNSLDMHSLGIVGASVFLCLLSAILLLYVGYKIVKIPFSLLSGMVSNQPAVMEFSTKRAGNRIPQIGFALILPIAMVLKIIIAQLLYIILR